jgi:hypothetical protein
MDVLYSGVTGFEPTIVLHDVFVGYLSFFLKTARKIP